MHYLESFTCPKNPRLTESNEDQTVIVPGIAYAVIDGATDITGRRWDDGLGNEATGGRLAATAIAAALRGLAAAPFHALPEPAAVLAAATGAVAAVYRRLGLLAEARAQRDSRFRATLAAAFIAGGRLRLLRVGDSDLRVNGRLLFEQAAPAEAVLITLRAEAWALLAGRGLAPDALRSATRALLVEGLDGAAGALSPADVARLAARTHEHPRVRRALGNDRENIDWILRGGLRGLRREPRGLTVPAIDGIDDPTAAARTRDLALAEVSSLEIVSDGYPAMPAEPSLAAWEALLGRADAEDPDRVGAFASTKGRVGDNFHDDRSIIIVRREAPRG